MKKLRNILFIILFILSCGSLTAQVAAGKDKDKTREVNPEVTGAESFANNTSPDYDISKQSKNDGNKTGTVKQVKSARPDMNRSHGARPPDIVRPSGSRIPKGVGRPAGAGMRGR
jgi:hypothetical protein